MIKFGSDISDIIYSLNFNQRQRLKNLFVEFEKEGVKEELFYNNRIEIKDVIEEIDSINEYEEKNKKIQEAVDKGETTIPKDEWGVHEQHCCEKHGCKYRDQDCPVAMGLTTGIICEDCDYDEC